MGDCRLSYVKFYVVCDVGISVVESFSVGEVSLVVLYWSDCWSIEFFLLGFENGV